MSFTNDDILVLARAGFSAQQIGALNSIQTPVQNGVQPTQTPVQPVQTPVQPVQTMVQPVQTTPVANQNNDTLSQILNAIQTNAINQTSQPVRQSTDDILAEIINPPVKE